VQFAIAILLSKARHESPTSLEKLQMAFLNNLSFENFRYKSIYIRADDSMKLTMDANTNGDQKADEKYMFHIASPVFFSWRSTDEPVPSECSPSEMSCCTTSLFMLLVIGLTFVIVLWVVALLADGLDDEVHHCVILWPVATAVSVIFILFFFLNGYEFCLRRKKRRENRPLDSLDTKRSNSMYCRRRDSRSVEWYVEYERSRCLWVLYLILTFALLCVMTASVEQYFSLDSRCYSNLKHNLDDLLMGYEFLAYMSVAVLSLLACISCLLFIAFLVYLREIARDMGAVGKAIKF